MIWEKHEAQAHLKKAWGNIMNTSQWTVLVLAILALFVRSRVALSGAALAAAALIIFLVVSAPTKYQPTPTEADFDRAAAQVVQDQIKGIK